MFFLLISANVVSYLICVLLATKHLYGLSGIAGVLSLLCTWVIFLIYKVKKEKRENRDKEMSTDTDLDVDSKNSNTNKALIATGIAGTTALALAKDEMSATKPKDNSSSSWDCSGLDCFPTDCGDCSGADCDNPAVLIIIPVIALVGGIIYLLSLLFKRGNKVEDSDSEDSDSEDSDSEDSDSEDSSEHTKSVDKDNEDA